MSEPAGKVISGPFARALQLLVWPALCVGMIWIAASQRRLFDEVVALREERGGLAREILDLRAGLDERDAKLNQGLTDSTSGVSDRLDQQSARIELVLKERMAIQDKSLADSLTLISSHLDQQTAVINSGVSDRLDQQSARIELVLKERMAIQGKSLAENLTLISSHVDQQTAVINRALGKVIPVVMPPAWETQLTQLEAQVREPGRWPSDASQAQSYFDQVSSLMKDTPAWAEADLLPRLTPLRWAAIAFVSVNRDRDGNSVSSIIDETIGLVNAAPDGSSAELLQRLKQEAKMLSEKVEQSKLADAIEAGRKYVQSGKAVSDDEAVDISNVYDLLGLHDQNGPQGSELRNLRGELHKLLIAHQGKRQAASLIERWVTVQDLKSQQPVVFEMSVNVLLQEAATTKVALAMEGVAEPTLDSCYATFRRVANEISAEATKREDDRQAKAIREYQRWALGQIVAFERAFEATSATASKNAGYVIGNGWTDDRYGEVREAMVEHLLPVNLILTDQPIQERYMSAFQKGWKKLEGREDQTIVAQKAALAVKKSARDFLEVQP